MFIFSVTLRPNMGHDLIF